MTDVVLDIDESNLKRVKFLDGDNSDSVSLGHIKCPSCGHEEVEVRACFSYGLSLYGECDECLGELILDESTFKYNHVIIVKNFEKLKFTVV